MTGLLSSLGFVSNPFEHYTAEQEPDIAQYAVKPPYLTTTVSRARGTSSFLLFGDRGAGKSATRITLYQELWSERASTPRGNAGLPLAINFVDFTKFAAKFKIGQFDENLFIGEVAFLVLEGLLAWLSSLTDEDREIYTELMDEEEKTLLIGMMRAFYLSRAENERHQTIPGALQLLNSAWTTKSALWIGRKWIGLSALFSSIVDLITKKYIAESADVAANVEAFLKSLGPDGKSNPRIVLEKLVDTVKVFGFSGVVVLIDKVDETEFTQNSAEGTAKLVYPLLAHVQLLEVKGFAWHLFLWSQIKPYFESGKLAVRLDKIASASVEWDDSFFRQMVESRIKFFSGGRNTFGSLFDEKQEPSRILQDLIETSMRSPRELVRLLDVIVVEHDIRYSEASRIPLLSAESISRGEDKYVKDRIKSVYEEKVLAQVYRLAKVRFTNKDVQLTFKINAQSARNKIKGWENLGLAKQVGTRAAEGEQGGKPSYEYAIADSRVERVISKRLIALEDYAEYVDDETDSPMVGVDEDIHPQAFDE